LPKDVTVVEGHFALEDADKDAIPAEFREATYVRGRKLDDSAWHRLDGGPPRTTYATIKKDLTRLCAHVDARVPPPAEGSPAPEMPSAQLATVTQSWPDDIEIKADYSTKLGGVA
jgi:hypothetical protein